MAKLKKPLFSLDAKGGLGKAISFVKRGGRNIAEKKPEVPDARTLAQLSWRHMYQKAVALWQSLSAAEKQEWESLARAKHMTGFAWFISQALKPNPGLYLPLQGGTMQGEIEMANHHLHGLPEPVHLQDPLRRQDYVDYIQPYLHYQGCKVWRTNSQTIPDSSTTTLIFDAEFYDTDEMHSLIDNPERITVKTPGIYLVTFHGYFNSNAVGTRRGIIYHKGAIIHYYRKTADPTERTFLNLTTVKDCVLNDYFTVRVWQDSGAPLTFRRSSYYSPIFAAQRIG